MCSFCKGISPSCNNCSTMGISNEFDAYKPVYLADPKIFSQVSTVQSIQKKEKSQSELYNKKPIYISRVDEDIVIRKFKKQLKAKRKLKENASRISSDLHPKLNEKFGDLFSRIKMQLQNRPTVTIL